MEKVKIIRKDGIVYERKVRTPTKLTKCLCLRLDEQTFNKLKEYDKPSCIIKKIIDEYLEKQGK